MDEYASQIGVGVQIPPHVVVSRRDIPRRGTAITIPPQPSTSYEPETNQVADWAEYDRAWVKWSNLTLCFDDLVVRKGWCHTPMG